MNCAELRENILELAVTPQAAPEVQQHLSGCAGCAAEVESFRKTMALLDEWQAPAETSQYFMTRLRARLREEAQREAPRGILGWLRRPALAVSMVALLVAGVSLFRAGDNQRVDSDAIIVAAPPSTAVGDLQFLEKNNDVLANFDLLDDLTEDPQDEIVTP